MSSKWTVFKLGIMNKQLRNTYQATEVGRGGRPYGEMVLVHWKEDTGNKSTVDDQTSCHCCFELER